MRTNRIARVVGVVGALALLPVLDTAAWAQAPSVSSFTLIDADRDRPVAGFDPIPSGATLNLATLPTRRLNIRANTSPAKVGSVRFGYDGNANYRTENGNPYTLAGDSSGNYAAWTPKLGSHTVTATPYSGASATGTKGQTKTLTFTVTDQSTAPAAPSSPPPGSTGRTTVSISGSRFYINGKITYPNTPAEGLLMNVRMVNAVFEDTNRPSFDPEANTAEFLAVLPQYVAAGVRAFSISLQGGNPSYEGAVNTAFTATGGLRASYMSRVQRVIEAADAAGAVIILNLFYQRQDQHLRDAQAVRNAIVNTARWLDDRGYTNVLLEIANEYTHSGFDHDVIRTDMPSLIQLARQTAPHLYVSASGYGTGTLAAAVAQASDYLLIHTNSISVGTYDDRIRALRGYGKPIVINEDPKSGSTGALAAETAVEHGASWGFFLRANQEYPFTFKGTADDPAVYAAIRELTGTTSAPPTAPAPPAPSGSPALILINAGGPDYLGTPSLLWKADRYYSGGRVSVGTTQPIAGTDDDVLYQTMRYGNMSYRIPVAPGTYEVTLHFAEIYWNAARKRVFDVRVEGQLAVDDLDIWATAGKYTAVTASVTVPVTDGTLDIVFTSAVDNACVSAIAVSPVAP